MKKPPPERSIPIRVLCAVFLTALTALLIEITLSRILAILLWHHFAFLIISCALLGYGVAGIWLYLFRVPNDPFIPVVVLAFVLFPLVILFNRLPFDPALVSLNPLHALYLVAMFLLLAIPFFLAGLSLVFILKRYPADSFRIYSVDLLGATCGCIGFFGLVYCSGETTWLIAITVLAAGAASLLGSSHKQFWFPFVSPLVLVILNQQSLLPALAISHYKALALALNMPEAKLLSTQWDAVSRIDRFESPLARFAPGLSLYYQGELPPQIGITIDGDQLTSHSRIMESDVTFWEHLPSRFLFQVEPIPKNALLLEIAGGDDLYQALRISGIQLTAQTEVRILGQWLKSRFPNEPLTVRTETARSLLETSTARFDRIVVSLEGALPTGGTGMNSLVESSLETTEGMASLLDRLSTQGWLSFHRYLLPPPRAELRLLLTLVAGMHHNGWDPKTQLAILQSVSTILIVVHAQEWSVDQVSLFRNYCREKGFTPLYYPGMPQEAINQTMAAILDAPRQVISASVFDLTPVTDNRPFFYHFLRIAKLGTLYKIFDGKWEALVEAGLLLPLLWCFVLVVALLFLILPLVLKSGTIFKIVLGTLLVSSGCGAIVFRRYNATVKRTLFLVLIAVLLLYFFGLGRILAQTLGWALPLRVLVATGLILLPGLLMGVPFPHGIHQLASRPDSDQRIFQAWCFNSFASVIGSVSAMLIAVGFGIDLLFLIAAFTYSLAAVTMSGGRFKRF